jgi:hypothetical protein
MLYSPDDLSLMLIDHENSFGTSLDRPAYIKDIELVIGDQWRSALSELNNEVLRSEFGDVLDDDRLAALETRRDALLNESSSSTLGGNAE